MYQDVILNLTLFKGNTMFAISILFLFIGFLITAGGAITWIATLLELVTAITPMQAFGIICGGIVVEVLAGLLCVAFRPKMEDVGSMMGGMLGNMMKGMESSLDDLDFD